MIAHHQYLIEPTAAAHHRRVHQRKNQGVRTSRRRNLRPKCKRIDGEEDSVQILTLDEIRGAHRRQRSDTSYARRAHGAGRAESARRLWPMHLDTANGGEVHMNGKLPGVAENTSL